MKKTWQDYLNRHDKEEEYILCAAIHYDDGVKHNSQPKNVSTGLVVCGFRHDMCVYIIAGMNPGYVKKYIGPKHQGFLTSKNIFVSRKLAYYIAFKAGQVQKSEIQSLQSEDLY